ncbi:uncharacterized protein LOC114328142 isoform X2 [Diabrotica virgifera virgifera]|nr:uncharacterized protein LOC114328142 isoform X2 [Diabrotica virgifera virgifera]
MATKYITVLLVCMYLHTGYCSLSFKDLGEHLQTDGVKWAERCHAITGVTEEEVEDAMKGIFPDTFGPYITCLWLTSEVMTPTMDIIPEKLQYYLNDKVLKSDEMAQYIPCAANARKLGDDVPFNKKVLEMNKCHYKINPDKYIIF